MDIREITDKKIWEDFLLGVSEKTFLNSWNWGEFNKAMKNKIWRLGVFNNKRLIALGLVSKIKAKRGTFLLLQHAPCIIANGEQFLKYDIVKSFLEELKKIAKEEKAIFIRMNPLWNRDVENIDTVRKLGFTEAPIHANAYESTWKLDISLPEDELLRQMRKTTRYLIRLASKNQDIIVEKSEKPNDISIYQELNKKVAQRQRFVPFSSDYIKNEFDIFSEPVSSVNRNSQIVLFLGRYKDEIASAALVIFWSGVAFYHQAASTSKFAKLSIPYLVMWEAIKEAKKRGCILYDFWGYVDPIKQRNHPWAGPTLFKMGFGGYKKEYLKTQDFPISKRYYLTRIFEKIRSFRRFSI